MDEQGSGKTVVSTAYGYFVVRLELASPDRPAGCAGMVERLGTGEKQRFGNGEELLKLLQSWPSDVRKLT